MPFREAVDGDEELQELIALWREGSDELDRRLKRIYDRIARILAGDEVVNDPDHVIKRLRIEATRLETLVTMADRIAANLLDETRSWLETGGLHRVYVGGAEIMTFPFQFSQPHRNAVEVLARDLFDDVLTATRFISDDAKDWVRRNSRELTGFKFTGGQTSRQAGRQFAAVLRREFLQRGIGGVRYANGSIHSFGEYGSMLLETKTGMAYNAGTLNASARAGVRVMELGDGANCGLTSHDDPQLAAGLIVPIEVAASYPLAHPRCRRVMIPRPDLTQANFEGAPTVAGADRDVFLEALRVGTAQAERARRGARRRRRRVR